MGAVKEAFVNNIPYRQPFEPMIDNLGFEWEEDGSMTDEQMDEYVEAKGIELEQFWR